MAQQAPTLDPAKTRPVGALPDGTEFRRFHLKPGCKAKGDWRHYQVDHAHNDRHGNVGTVSLPRTIGITFIRALNPTTPVEVVGELPAAPVDPPPAD